MSRWPVCLLLPLLWTPIAAAEWRVTGQVGGPVSALAVQGTLAVVGVGARLHLYDITNPASPSEVGTTEAFGDSVTNVTISGSRAFVTAGTSGLHIIDLADPANAARLTTWNSPGSAEGVAVDGQFAFLADGPFGLQIVDISNVAAPMPVASAYDMQFAFDVIVHQRYAFVAAASAGVLVVDVSDPAHPRDITTFDTPGHARDLVLSGSTLYVADAWGGIRVLDVSTPSRPVEIGSVSTSSFAFGVDLSGSMLHVANGGRGLAVIDVSDPREPRLVATYDRAWRMSWKVVAAGDRVLLGVREEGVHIIDIRDVSLLKSIAIISPLIFARYVATSGALAFVATGAQGMRVVDLSNPSRPRERGRGDSDALGWAITASDRLVYICEGVLPEQRLRVFDVGDPDRPVPLGSYRLTAAEGVCRDLARDGTWLYVPNEFGLVSFDLTNPQQLMRGSSVQFEPDGKSPDGTSGAISVAIGVSNIAFVSASVNGVKSVDISQPGNLRIAGAWSETDPPAQIFHVAYQNGFVYAAGGAFVVLDVRDPARPALTGKVGLGGASGLKVRGSTAFVAAGGRGLLIIDVSDPASPTITSRVSLPCSASDVAFFGERLVVACSSGGLVVLENVMGVAKLDAAKAMRSEPRPAPLARGTMPPPVVMPSQQLPVVVAAGRSVVVTSAADSGSGTLRAALNDLQAGDVITFDRPVFPPAAPATIRLQTRLPPIMRDGVTIDASNAGVILDGSRLTGEFAPGLDINSANNTIKGLQITGFQSPAIVLQGRGGNVIGGDRSRGSAILGEANIIYGYQFTGIASSSAGNLIIGNQIGTDPSGLRAPGGQRRGIGLSQPGDRIEGNVIAGNIDAEIYLHNARGNTIIGNFLGTDPSGTARVGAAFASIASSFAADNLITGNVIAGIVNLTDPGSYCNRVTNNWIGVARNGSSLTSQGQGASVTISEPFNVVSDNVLGIVGVGGASDTVIIGNTVGTEPRRGLSGIFVSASSRTFIEGNSVYASPRGIWLFSGVSRTFISRNTIVGNDDGISIDDADTSVIQGNVIARSLGAGIVVSTPRNRIRRNSIFENGATAIAITAGVTVPQPPNITSATRSGIEGFACSGCTVEIFSDLGSQGRRYEASVVASQSGQFAFSGWVAGPNVTATATDIDGSTSAFSLPVATTPPPPRRRAVRR